MPVGVRSACVGLSYEGVWNFWKFVGRRGDDECWPWMASRAGNGYGQYTPLRAERSFTRTRGAHRLIFATLHGPIPPELCVCHKCDNPPCCNPAHLFLGTVADNSADMVAKGRSGKVPRPEIRKFSDAEIAEMVARVRAGEPRTSVAAAFGVSEHAIKRYGNQRKREAYLKHRPTLRAALEALPAAPQNYNSRKTHCANGHAFTPENTRIEPNGARACRACSREKTRRRRASTAGHLEAR